MRAQGGHGCRRYPSPAVSLGRFRLPDSQAGGSLGVCLLQPGKRRVLGSDRHPAPYRSTLQARRGERAQPGDRDVTRRRRKKPAPAGPSVADRFACAARAADARIATARHRASLAFLACMRGAPDCERLVQQALAEVDAARAELRMMADG